MNRLSDKQTLCPICGRKLDEFGDCYHGKDVGRSSLPDCSQPILAATMKGYVAGIADGTTENPYAYILPEAWAWEHGREQGRQHRVRCDVRAALS